MTKNQVHGLWIDGALPPLAVLTARSFLQHHGSFTLWTYNAELQVPNGVVVKDAREIVDHTDVFTYRAGVVAGSYGGFSDIFRARLLYLHGGWWTDMDVTLMSPIPDDFLAAPIVLRSHWKNNIVGNVMKFPQGSPVMDKVYQLSRHAVTEKNQDWDMPIRLLSRAVTQARLLKYRRCIGHRDEFIDVLPFMRLPIRIPQGWWAMHWCNEMFRRGHHGIKLFKKSHLADLFRQYSIDKEPCK